MYRLYEYSRTHVDRPYVCTRVHMCVHIHKCVHLQKRIQHMYIHTCTNVETIWTLTQTYAPTYRMYSPTQIHTLHIHIHKRVPHMYIHVHKRSHLHTQCIHLHKFIHHMYTYTNV